MLQRSKTEFLLIFLTFLLIFISYSMAVDNSQSVCQENLDKSFLKVIYSLEGSKVSFNIKLLNVSYDDNKREQISPINGGLIIIKNVSSDEDICYVVTNNEGDALTEFDIRPGMCQDFLLEFKPDGNYDGVKSCGSENSPIIYTNSFIGSRFSAHICAPPKTSANIAVCWFATLIGGLIFAASFIMGRNPFLFFDFSSSRSLSPRFSSAQAGYNPMTKSTDSQTTSEKVRGVAMGALDTSTQAINTLNNFGISTGSVKEKLSDIEQWAEDPIRKASNLVFSKQTEQDQTKEPSNLVSSKPIGNEPQPTGNEPQKIGNEKINITVGDLVAGGVKTMVTTVAFAVAPRRAKTQKKPTLGTISKTFGGTLFSQVYSNALGILKQFLIQNMAQNPPSNQDHPFELIDLFISRDDKKSQSPEETMKRLINLASKKLDKLCSALEKAHYVPDSYTSREVSSVISFFFSMPSSSDSVTSSSDSVSDWVNKTQTIKNQK